MNSLCQFHSLCQAPIQFAVSYARASATVTASGEVTPLTYHWSPGNQTTPTISSQCAGTYSVTVTDANGCNEIFDCHVNAKPYYDFFIQQSTVRVMVEVMELQL